MADGGRSKQKRAGVEAGGEPASPSAERPSKMVEWRMKVPKVLDDAAQAYADALHLGKTAAARSLLMRLLVKRTVYVPDPLHESPEPAT